MMILFVLQTDVGTAVALDGKLILMMKRLKNIGMSRVISVSACGTELNWMSAARIFAWESMSAVRF